MKYPIDFFNEVFWRWYLKGCWYIELDYGYTYAGDKGFVMYRFKPDGSLNWRWDRRQIEGRSNDIIRKILEELDGVEWMWLEEGHEEELWEGWVRLLPNVLKEFDMGTED